MKFLSGLAYVIEMVAGFGVFVVMSLLALLPITVMGVAIIFGIIAHIMGLM